MCLADVPAEYQTVTRQGVKTPADVRDGGIPAEGFGRFFRKRGRLGGGRKWLPYGKGQSGGGMPPWSVGVNLKTSVEALRSVGVAAFPARRARSRFTLRQSMSNAPLG